MVIVILGSDLTKCEWSLHL